MAVTRLSDLNRDDIEDNGASTKGSFRVRPSGYRFPVGLNLTPNTNDTYNVFATATGGTQTTTGSGASEEAIHTFTSSGSFEVSEAPTYMSVQILAVGGGGGGGGAGGGGGGAGGLVYMNDYKITNTSYTITIGSGGTGASAPAASLVGGFSNVKYTGASAPITGNVIARRGGAGGSDGGQWPLPFAQATYPGFPAPQQASYASLVDSIGSQGGSSSNWGAVVYDPPGTFMTTPGGTATVTGASPGDVSSSGIHNFGNLGGRAPTGGLTNSDNTGIAGGGGGGAGGAGVPTLAPTNASDGGAGLQYSISGTALYYAGGGGGGYSQTAGSGAINPVTYNNFPNWSGQGGSGIGGNAGTPYPSAGGVGTINRGSGGGAATGRNDNSIPGGEPGSSIADRTGGNGGDGVVIIRYNSFQANDSFDVN